MPTIQLDILSAIEAKDKGMNQAIDHADEVVPGWSERAYKMFCEWLNGWPSGYRFQIEGFRVSAYARGLPKPPTDRAFAVVAVRARKAGLIKSNGQKATSSATAHRCYANEWEKI